MMTTPSSRISSSSFGTNPTKMENRTTIRNSSTFSHNKNEEFRFIKPAECPVFTPNEEEFNNPLAYICKIRPFAETYGIVKIKPPKTWNPTFTTVDVDKFKFTPRVQRLNKLEAKTRVKLNFLDQIEKFWDLQGSPLKTPKIKRKALDLYSLYRIVQEEGGSEQITKEFRWTKIADRMSYPTSKNIGGILKGHYERILYPFDVYTSGKLIDKQLNTQIIEQNNGRAYYIESQEEQPIKTSVRCSKRLSNSTKKSFDLGPSSSVNRNKIDPLSKYICHICNRGDSEKNMLLCDGCDDSYHIFCLLPSLKNIPKEDWFCPKCIAEEVNKQTSKFGFDQAQQEYTLQQFGEMADKFKEDYFNRAVHLIPIDLVEREFWRILSSIDEDVTVEYGADLHEMDHSSEFPKKSSYNLLPADREYAESNWNLNNLPILEESILRYINTNITGMEIPWMYVGMCFATFCWHTEDHWSYSINYLHWGEPKTWYGVPGNKAEAFEETIKSTAPELFQSQPDLLHQLVTIMNPNILMKNNVPVYRTDQQAGEFVITFPKAYHAGFNQGYNFAEAVNFAPADWIKFGRECINHYSMLRRFCVFSHDELICNMALNPYKINIKIATACYLDMAEMLDSEKILRKSVQQWGVTKAEHQIFELIPDDERLCDLCKTTCFLSALTCSCTKSKVCLRHYKELCKCSPDNHTLQYRYTLSELSHMFKKLRKATNGILVTNYSNNKSSCKKRASADDSDVGTIKKTNNENLVKAKTSRKLKKKSTGETSNDLQMSLNISDNNSIQIEPLEVLPTNSSINNITLTGKKRKRRSGKKLNKKKLTQAQSSDEDGKSSASNCASPSGREVNWVQWDDVCNKWYHMLCVGIDINDIKPDDDYICKQNEFQKNN